MPDYAVPEIHLHLLTSFIYLQPIYLCTRNNIQQHKIDENYAFKVKYAQDYLILLA